MTKLARKTKNAKGWVARRMTWCAEQEAIKLYERIENQEKLVKEGHSTRSRASVHVTRYVARMLAIREEFPDARIDGEISNGKIAMNYLTMKAKQENQA